MSNRDDIPEPQAGQVWVPGPALPELMSREVLAVRLDRVAGVYVVDWRRPTRHQSSCSVYGFAKWARRTGARPVEGER